MDAGWRMVAALLDALPDPLPEIRLRRQLASEAYERGRADGWREGYERAEADMARRWREIARPIARGGITNRELESRRWGSGGRKHFADPRPGDRGPRKADTAA